MVLYGFDLVTYTLKFDFFFLNFDIFEEEWIGLSYSACLIIV